jgi:hypothetical protein
VTEAHVSLVATAGCDRIHSGHRGNKEAAFYSGFVIPKEPSDGLEPSTPSLPCAARGSQWQLTATVLACFCGFGGGAICA